MKVKVNLIYKCNSIQALIMVDFGNKHMELLKDYPGYHVVKVHGIQQHGGKGVSKTELEDLGIQRIHHKAQRNALQCFFLLYSLQLQITWQLLYPSNP